MKLLTKYNRVNILATSIVFVIAGCCYFFILQYVLINQLDKDLHAEELAIKEYINKNNQLPDSTNYYNQKVFFETTDQSVVKKISSQDILDTAENEYTITRQLIFPIYISGKNYAVSVSKSQQETEDLIQLIVSITLVMVILLLLLLFLINRFVLNKLWLPFNNTLNELKQFNLSSIKPMKLNKSEIKEFNELNNAVLDMNSRVVKDYDAMKSFTENASHEMQTPLAVMNSKLELLIQSENFTEGQMKHVESMHEEIRKLSKLNQSLLLLTKIDNHQFGEMQQVDLVKIIRKHLNNYEELIESKQITLTEKLDNNSYSVLMNESLADVLISNLISNAIKHNIEKGSIEINLIENILSVQNTGNSLNINPEELFERFRKDKTESDSLGLGLSIVKKIVEQYQFSIQYEYNNGLHCISIQFS